MESMQDLSLLIVHACKEMDQQCHCNWSDNSCLNWAQVAYQSVLNPVSSLEEALAKYQEVFKDELGM